MLNYREILKKYINYNPQEMRYKSPNFWGTTLTWSIIGSFSFTIIFACIARIDEVVITRGELQAQGSLRPIKMPFTNQVKKIFVDEGDEVIKNQLLIKLDTDVFEARKEKLILEKASLNGIILNEKNVLNRIKKILEEGAITYIEYVSQKNKVEELTLRQKQINEELKEIDYQLDKSHLKSPLAGKVFNLVAFSSGYAGREGEILLEIVPAGSLEAKIDFNNADVGFIRPNMRAEIRIDAYPFAQFGSIEGTLKSIGEDSLPPDQFNNQIRFPGYVSLSKQYLEKGGRKYFLKSGQTVTVNFIVRDKPLITLLTDVIANSWDSLRGIKTEGSR